MSQVLKLFQIENGKLFSDLRRDNFYLRKNDLVYQVYDDKWISHEPVKLNPNSEFEIIDREVGPLELDIFTQGRHLQIPLLTDAERLEVTRIDKNISDFEEVVKSSIRKRREMFSNFIIISGAPGIGKTYLTRQWANELIEENVIREFQTVSAKMTPISLFQFMKNSDEDVLQILDDCDPWHNTDSLNIMKAALDTRSSDPNNRIATYGSRGSLDQFKYESFMIVLTNQKFDAGIGEHLKAVLDRGNLFELPLKPEDMFIKNTALVEEFLNDPDNLDGGIKLFTFKKIGEFFHEDVRQFNELNIFREQGVNFSVRYVMKLVDLYLTLGDKWKLSSIEYQRMDNARKQKLALLDKTTNL